jgi:branched-chain amino acid transport system ATP-binding protein/nonpolar-amino-acid-transporting ATPase
VFGKLTVRENLMLGSYRQLASGVPENMLGSRRSRADLDSMHAHAAQACERFGLGEVMERLAGEVPAGIQRLVELARGCISRPRLLMLDEPSSGLNPSEIRQLRELLQQLNREGITILLVSHDMHLVDVASRVHVLCFGSIMTSGAMSQIKQDERVRQAYLGVS